MSTKVSPKASPETVHRNIPCSWLLPADKWRRIVLGGSAMLSAGTQLEGRVKEEKQARLERDKRLRQATAIEDVSS